MERSAPGRHDNDADACAGRRYQHSELIQELHGRQIKNRLPIRPGDKQVADPSRSTATARWQRWGGRGYWVLTNSAVERYQTAPTLKVILCRKKGDANNKFATKSRETLEPFVY
jgi:hypothetical protein